MKPNVLFISTDDMNDWVGCLDRYPGVSTPSIDSLASDGVLFSNAHCPSPLCNPSRTAILTGLRPNSSGVYGNDHWWRPALPDVVTLPEHFRRNGYHAAGAGKVFHHTDGFNPPEVWDEFFAQVFDDPWSRRDTHGGANGAFPDWHPMNGLQPYVHELDWGALDLPEHSYGDARAVDWGVEFLRRRAVRPEAKSRASAAQTSPEAKPFFLAVGAFRPHLPNYAPRRYFDRYPLDRIRLPNVFDTDMEAIPAVGRELAGRRRADFERIRDQGQWEEAVQAYLACISFADAQIGRLLAALDESGLAASTIVVFFSDNGFHLGQKHHWYKCTLWEPGTHVPFILRIPEGLRRNRAMAARAECRRAVNLIDIYPTLVDLCGLPSPESRLDGASLAPLLLDPSADPGRPSVITFERGNHAVRSDEYRYIRYADGGEELYRTDEDPDETMNLAADAGYRDIREQLSRWVPAKNALPVPGRNAYDFDPERYSWRPRSGGG